MINPVVKDTFQELSDKVLFLRCQTPLEVVRAVTLLNVRAGRTSGEGALVCAPQLLVSLCPDEAAQPGA